ncbi:MAG: DEAD/DEAH box helicase, partial [Acidimicrobiales bacterium]
MTPVEATFPGGPPVVRKSFETQLGFELDSFQTRALDSLDAGRSVLVAAPTGSGKTVVAEYAVALALQAKGQAFYTSPLKALSNQKYLDLSTRFGPSVVGLMTGDNAIHPDAPVVVMTTEILRNMIYERSSRLAQLRYVILDEVHYLQNPYRGAVWEEVIIHSPTQARLVCLSATVSNAEEFAAWMATVRGEVDTVIEEKRPVRLDNLYMVGERGASAPLLLPMFIDGRPNPQALTMDGNLASAPRGRSTGRPPSNRSTRYGWGHTGRRMRAPRRFEVIEALRPLNMLPAIYFIFSRAGCENALSQCLGDGLRLNDGSERQAVRALAEHHVDCLSDADLEMLGYDQWISGLEAGLAAHHAGMVPPFKEAVEAAFVQGLVKVVFATETLSLGVNMPARTVVIEKLIKFNGERKEALTPGEYTQLTGRAGRRGLDERGFAVVLWSSQVGFGQVAGLAGTRSYALTSSFRPTYNMAANLIRRYPSERAHELLNLSFAQYQTDAKVVNLQARLEAARREGRASEADRLVRRLAGRQESLSRHLDRVLALLEREGFTHGWALTPAGHQLARVYHETDLVVAQALSQGLFDDLAAADLAGLASVFTFESRERASGRSEPARVGQGGKLWSRWSRIEEALARLNTLESDFNLPLTRKLDPGFMASARAWCQGRGLAGILEQSGASGGDFVRNIKQLIDLVSQIAQVASDPATRGAASTASGELFRGVVQASSVLAGTEASVLEAVEHGAGPGAGPPDR